MVGRGRGLLPLLLSPGALHRAGQDLDCTLGVGATQVSQPWRWPTGETQLALCISQLPLGPWVRWCARLLSTPGKQGLIPYWV